MKEITKEQVLNAIDLIESYKTQESNKINAIIVKSDNRKIETLDLNKRSYRSLKAAKINTIGELTRYDLSDLRKFRNLGDKSILDIMKCLKIKGIEIH